jgi:hypothetical protein
MSSFGASPLRDEAALTKAIEGVLRRLIRFLIGKISLTNLQQMIRIIFVEEVEDQLKQENPERNISLTKIALLSGLDTRALTKIRNSEYYRRSFSEGKSFLRELTPASSILDVWTTKSPYYDSESKEPKGLVLHGEGESFESLCAEVIKSRGVTDQSILNRMLATGAIRLDEETNTVHVVSHTYIPSDGSDQQGATEMGFSAVSKLIDTVCRNIRANNDGDRLFQRGIWTFRCAPEDRLKLREEMHSVLSKADLEAQKTLIKFEQDTSKADQITAGVSLFYFEDEVEDK